MKLPEEWTWVELLGAFAFFVFVGYVFSFLPCGTCP